MRSRNPSFDEETIARVGKALQRRRSQDELDEESNEKKDAQIEKDAQAAHSIALREAVLSSLDGTKIHAAARHSGVSAAAVFAVQEELCTSDSKWMEEKENPRPDSASLRHLNELCGVKQECAWTPRDMREALKLILIHGEQVGVAGACVK